MDLLLCVDSEATVWGLFNPDLAPLLLFYAYIPTIFLSLMLGVFVLLNKRAFSLPNKLFFAFTSLYSLYISNEIMQWISIPAGIVNFGWELIALFFTALAIVLFYFVYSFVENKDLSLRQKTLISALAFPVILFLPTSLNTESFDILYCEGTVGILYYYIYALMVIFGLSICFVCIKNYIKTKRAEVLLLMFGSVAMLFILTLADIISEYLGTFEINLVGPIGMIIFLTVISYMIVQFKAFNIKLAGAQALVLGLLLLVGSLMFVVKSPTSQAVAGATFIFTAISGFFLVRSVKKEIKQREELEVLTKKLEAANQRLKELDKAKSEFVSIASHQLRSPLTAIRGYASMLAEGSFGKMPEKAMESAKRIEDSAKLMAMSIEDYLNVSRIESGNMKYNTSDFNVRDMVDNLCDDLRPEALKKNLILLFRSNLQSRGVVSADVGKTNQIIHNLINNSLKYTEKGSISIFVRDDIKKKRVYVDITDTGIGMSKETVAKLFHKFSRADNANSVNVSGTGLGLFVALKMAEAMGGDITCKSDGNGKGSTFTFELPLAM